MRKYIYGIFLGMCCGFSTFASFAPGIDWEKLPAQIKSACQSQPAGAECSQAFSCEKLFTDHKEATSCNYKRCLTKRADSYCSCKYGSGGDGKAGIPLNTDIPFVGNCLAKSDGTTGNVAALNAFPTIISAISRMLVTVILLAGFIMIVVGGVQWASGDAKSGKDKLKKVAIGFALLGMMGAILRFINPNFFK